MKVSQKDCIELKLRSDWTNEIADVCFDGKKMCEFEKCKCEVYAGKIPRYEFCKKDPSNVYRFASVVYGEGYCDEKTAKMLSDVFSQHVGWDESATNPVIVMYAVNERGEKLRCQMKNVNIIDYFKEDDKILVTFMCLANDVTPWM